MITEDYVSFETAKLLKEKGFNEPCVYVYRHDGSEDIWDADKEDIAYQKPTLQMAMKWLREVHKLAIYPFLVNLMDIKSAWWYRIVRNTGLVLIDEKEEDPIYGTYEQACEEAIKYCLENLI